MSKIVAAVFLLGFCTPGLAASALEGLLAKQGFKHLNGGQIRQAFVGKKFTDEVHFGYAYKADGSTEGMSMGKKHTGKFVIADNRLCVTDRFGEICYDVWKKGPEVRLVVGESDLSLDGFLR